MSSLLFALASAHASPHVAVVVIDPAARDEGFALQIDDWWVDDVLPVEVAEGEKVLVVDADGHAEPLEFEPGEAWEISGSRGEAWMSMLEEEVRTDLIAVKGPIRSIVLLADSLDAEVVRDGETTYLSGKDILYEARWGDEDAVKHIEGVQLVLSEAVESEKPTASLTKPSPVARTAPVATIPSTTPVPPKAVEPEIATLAVTVDERVSPVIEETAEVPTPALEPTHGERSRARYAGTKLCSGNPIVLTPQGLFGYGQATGTWTVTAPGVVRLHLDDGTLWGKAAMNPQTGQCLAVWENGWGDQAPMARDARTRTLLSLRGILKRR